MITAEHVIAAVLLGLACMATGWVARGGWDRAGQRVEELANLDDPEADDRWADLLAPAPATLNQLGLEAGALAHVLDGYGPEGPPPGTWTAWELAHLHPGLERAVTPEQAWAEWEAGFAAGTDRLIEAIRGRE